MLCDCAALAKNEEGNDSATEDDDAGEQTDVPEERSGELTINDSEEDGLLKRRQVYRRRSVEQHAMA